jgi:hypothetical protein
MKMSMEHWWNDTGRGNRSTLRRICPDATFSTTNRTWDSTACTEQPESCIKILSYRSVNTPRLGYKTQTVKCCLLPDPYKTHPIQVEKSGTLNQCTELQEWNNHSSDWRRHASCILAVCADATPSSDNCAFVHILILSLDCITAQCRSSSVALI